MEKKYGSVFEIIQDGKYSLLDNYSKEQINQELASHNIMHVVNSINKIQTCINEDSRSTVQGAFSINTISIIIALMVKQNSGSNKNQLYILGTGLVLSLIYIIILKNKEMNGAKRFNKIATEFVGGDIPEIQEREIYVSKISTLPNAKGKRPKVKTLI